MPEQLKIIIDADVNKAIAGVQNLSKVIALDFANATKAASVAATNLSSDVAASVQKINASLSGLKITSLDVSLNTSSIDASIKSIQSKFNALVDPQINVLANTELAEVRIKELVGDLATLKGSEIFIRANDVQALQKINEIEAELNSLVGKQINLTVTADLSKIEELKAKISSLKVTPVDIAVNTSGIDAQIKNIQAKFNALIDPQINVLANTEQAEIKVKELIGELSALRGSEIFIRANDAQALKVINEVEAELNSLVDKQIRLNVSTSEATQKINLLEKELLNLQTLSVAPNISTTQLALFETNIKRIKGEIAALKGQGVIIPIEANTVQAQRNVNLLSDTIETLRAKAEARKFFITTETDITKVAAYNKEIQKLEDEVRRLQNIGKKGFELFVVPNQTINSVKSLTASVAAFGGGVKTFIPPAIAGFNKLGSSVPPVIGQLKALQAQSIQAGAATTNAFSKAFGGLRSFAALIPGFGIGGLIAIATTEVIKFGAEIFNASKNLFQAEIEARKFADSIGDIKSSIDNFFVSIDFENKLQKLRNQLTFGDLKAGVLNIEVDTKSAQENLKFVEDEISKFTLEIGRVFNNQSRFLSKDAQTLLTSYISALQTGSTVPQEFVDRLTEADKKLFNVLNESAASIGALTTQQTRLRRTLAENEISSQLEKQKQLKAILDKQKADFEKFVNDTITKAQQFKKQFGDTFVLPELEVSFFTSKEQVFKNALKVLSDVKSDISKKAALEKLQIKLPVLVTTETKLNADDLKKFLRGQITQDQIRTTKLTIPIVTDFDLQIAENLPKQFEELQNEFVRRGIEAFKIQKGIPIEVNLDPTLSKSSIDAIDKLFDVRKQLESQFEALGDLGKKAFSKISFLHINEGLAEATKKLQNMMEVANTLNQAIGQGLVGAFNSVFDAVLEGKSVFKALGEAVKQLVMGTIKAVAQMLILRAVTAAIFPGAGAAGGLGGLIGGAVGGSANFGSLSGIGNRAFDNLLQINVVGQISGDVINLAGQRAANSQRRGG